MKLKGLEPHPKDCKKCDSKSKGFLCSTSDEISKKIAQIKVDCHYKAGEIIFRQGDFPLGLFSIRSGIVKIESLSEDGNAHTLRLAGSGDLLGYKTFFSGETYKNNSVAVEETSICFFPRKEVLNLFQCHPELGFKLISQLSSDLAQIEDKWVSQIEKGAPARVAEALLFLKERFADSSWTRKEIAEWAGTTPETVIRTLAQFEKEGIISQNYKNFNILLEEKLIQKAHS
jgi:CRP-like cAMP-binding protein